MKYVLYSMDRVSDFHMIFDENDNSHRNPKMMLDIANDHRGWQNRGFCFWLGADADV